MFYKFNQFVFDQFYMNHHINLQFKRINICISNFIILQQINQSILEEKWQNNQFNLLLNLQINTIQHGFNFNMKISYKGKK